jgi:hypothetical protein
MSTELFAQMDSVSVEKKQRSKFGVSISLNYSSITKGSIDNGVPEIVRPNISDNHKGRLGHSINIYNEYVLTESSNLLLGFYVSYEGYQSEEDEFRYYDFPTAPSDTLKNENTLVEVKYNNRYNFIGISVGFKKYVSSNKNMFLELGIIPKYLISMTSLGEKTQNGNVAGNGWALETRDYRRSNIDIFIAFGHSLELDEKNRLEILPVYRYSFQDENGLPYSGNLWNIGLTVRYAFGS